MSVANEQKNDADFIDLDGSCNGQQSMGAVTELVLPLSTVVSLSPSAQPLNII